MNCPPLTQKWYNLPRAGPHPCRQIALRRDAGRTVPAAANAPPGMVTGMRVGLSHGGRLRRERLGALCSLWISACVVLCPSFPSFAQNSAVAFNDAQPVPLANACSNAFAGHFHRGPTMDQVTTCTPADFPGQGPFTAVLMNQGNGMFKPVEDVAIDGIASPALAVDMNGDGLADLILNQQFSATIGVQLSNGDGTFRPPVYYTPTALPANSVLSAAAAGDFNGDGKTDLAIITTVFTTTTAIPSTNTLTIFLNTCSGALKQAARYTLDSIPASENAPLLVAGELDGDHQADLAVVYRSPSGKTTPYFATANGEFRKGITYHVGAYPSGAAIGKITSSGYGDIVVTTQSGIAILLGSSSGTFTSAGVIAYPPPVPQFGAGAQLALGDFDHDGLFDLAITDTNFVHVYWGEGTGKFTGPDAYSVPSYPLALLAADTQGTGRDDLVSATQNAGLSILANEDHRHFRAAPTTHSPYATGIVAADFNRDGKPGVAIVNTPACAAPCNGSVTVFAGTGGEWFNAGKRYAIGMHGSAIAAGDLNGDGIPDLVVTNATVGDDADVSVLLGVKGGGFAAARNDKLGSLSNDVFLVDVNKDGKLDLVEDGGVALGKGDGTFGPLKPFPDGLAFGKPYPTVFSMHLAVGDLNGDGIPDLVASFIPPGMSPFATEVWVLIGNGKGAFTATQLYDANQLVQEVVGVGIGNLRKGGHPDIVLANVSVNPSGGDNANAVIFAGDGAGTFQESAITTANTDATINGAVAIADFNHDGFDDIGIVSGDQFTVALGRGDGTFAALSMTFPITSGTQTNPAGSLAVADFNNDGWPDVLFTSGYGIARLYNQPVPLVAPATLTYAASGTQVVTVSNTLKHAEAMSAALPDPAQSPFRIIANTCKGSLAPAAKCSVSVEYASPGAPATDTLYIRANGVFIANITLNGN